MKKGIITNKWNFIKDGVIIAQCFADTKYEAIGFFMQAELDVHHHREVVMDPVFNTKEK